MRPLWVDECWSAIEIVNRSFWDILRNNYIFPISSRPPMFFVLIEKMAVVLFGDNEFALRLPPLLFSIGSVIVFYFLTKKIISPRFCLIAIWLFALSEPLVYYAAEAKRYSTQVFAALLIWSFAVFFLKEGYRVRWLFFFGLFGAFILWLSRTSFFILFGVFLLLGLKMLSRKKYREILCLVGAAVPFSISFSLLYFFVFKEVIVGQSMKDHFSYGFWDGEPLSGGMIQWMGKVIIASISNPAGLGFPFIAFILILLGIRNFSKRDAWLSALFWVPLALALLAAMTGHYPYWGRVIIFVVPAYFIFLTYGLEAVFNYSFKAKFWIGAALLVIVFFQPVYDSLYYLTHSRLKTDNRKMLQFFSENYQPGDSVYVNEGVRYPYYYYARSLGYGKRVHKIKYTFGEGNEQRLSPLGVLVLTNFLGRQQVLLANEYLFFNDRGSLMEVYIARTPFRVLTPENVKSILSRGRIWVLSSDLEENVFEEREKVLKMLFERAELILSYQAQGVAAYLFKI